MFRNLLLVLWLSIVWGELYAVEHNISSPSLKKDQRLSAWQKFIHSSAMYTSEKELLQAVNFFINQNRYSPDLADSGFDRNWQAPWDFIASGFGDCEEYAMAKFFTLQAMGIPTRKMRLVFVLVDQEKTPHLVLSYQGDDKSAPLILDNLTDVIYGGGQRTDLLPVFSFSFQEIWLMKDWRTSIRSPHKLNLPGWQRIRAEWDSNLKRYR